MLFACLWLLAAVLAFVAATLLTSPPETRLDLLARALIVRDAVTLRQLEASSGLLIILPFEDELRREAQLVRSHHVIFLAPQDVPAQIALPSIDRIAFQLELEQLGVPEELRRALSAAAHRSTVAFQRETPSGGRVPRLDWSELLRSRIVRRAWLAGAWSERRSGDLDVVSTLLDSPYDDARDDLREVARTADPLITVTGDSWSVVAPLQVWDHGHGRLNAGDLSRLEAAVQTVLGAIDPALELPVEDRWKAGIYGKTRVHSADLRRGLATSLALLGARGDALNLGGGRTARTWAEGVVFSLLERANQDVTGQLWASLSDILPLLAEAAPDVFLRAVQEGVSGDDPVLRKLFVDQGDALSVNSPHTGLLWALEALAWSAQHLGLAADMFARLAEIDPGGRLSNRPAASLAAIFRPWLPQTSASAESRLSVLDAIRAQHEDIGWSLLLDLLPQSHAVGMYSHGPIFRDWKPLEEAPPRHDGGEVGH